MLNPDAEFVRNFCANMVPQPMHTNDFLVALGAELIGFDPELKELTMRFCPAETFRQGAGNIQGGAISAILDFAMVFSAFAVIAPDMNISTTSMTTNFFAPGTSMDFTAIGKVEKAGRKMIFSSAKLFSGDTPIASATSGLIVLPART